MISHPAERLVQGLQTVQPMMTALLWNLLSHLSPGRFSAYLTFRFREECITCVDSNSLLLVMELFVVHTYSRRHTWRFCATPTAHTLLKANEWQKMQDRVSVGL